MNTELNKTVKLLIGPVLAEHVKTRKLVLTLTCDSPEWASQVLFLKKQLLATLNEHLPMKIDDLNVQLRRTDVV